MQSLIRILSPYPESGWVVMEHPKVARAIPAPETIHHDPSIIFFYRNLSLRSKIQREVRQSESAATIIADIALVSIHGKVWGSEPECPRPDYVPVWQHRPQTRMTLYHNIIRTNAHNEQKLWGLWGVDGGAENAGLNEKSAQRRRKHCALAVWRSQTISSRRRPPSRGSETARI